MPQVSRDKFNAAAAKVVAAAPPGLSRDQLFDLIDKELASDPNNVGTVIGDVKSGATPQPTENDPSFGGFVKNTAKSAIETAGGLAEGAFNMIAHPIKTATGMTDAIHDRMVEIGSDIHPIQAWDAAKKGNLTEAAGQLLPVGEIYKNPVQLAADVLAAISAGKVLKAGVELPTTMRRRNLESRVDRYLPNKSAASHSTFGEAAEPILSPVDRNMPNKSMSVDTRGMFGDPADKIPPFHDRYMANRSGTIDRGDPDLAPVPPAVSEPTVDRYMPNKSASEQGFGEGADPHSSGVDRYMPNKSNYTDASGRDLGTGVSGAEGRPSGPWDENTTGSLNKIVEDELVEENTPSTKRESWGVRADRAASRGEFLPKRAPSPVAVSDLSDDDLIRHFSKVQSNPDSVPESVLSMLSSEMKKRGIGPDQQNSISFKAMGGKISSVDPPKVKIDTSNKYPPEGGQGDWHAYDDDAARKAADPTERSQASNLHRETRALDDRYDFLSDPDNNMSAFTGPEALFAGLARDLIREQLRKLRGQTANMGPIRRGIKYGVEAGKVGAAGGNIARIGSQKED